MPAYGTLDVRVGLKGASRGKQQWELSIHADNILDKPYFRR